MEGLLGRNWIGSGESIFYSLVQHLFAAFARHLQYFRRCLTLQQAARLNSL
jgi:hypothetical protein